MKSVPQGRSIRRSPSFPARMGASQNSNQLSYEYWLPCSMKMRLSFKVPSRTNESEGSLAPPAASRSARKTLSKCKSTSWFPGRTRIWFPASRKSFMASKTRLCPAMARSSRRKDSASVVPSRSSGLEWPSSGRICGKSMKSPAMTSVVFRSLAAPGRSFKSRRSKARSRSKSSRRRLSGSPTCRSLITATQGFWIRGAME